MVFCQVLRAISRQSIVCIVVGLSNPSLVWTNISGSDEESAFVYHPSFRRMQLFRRSNLKALPPEVGSDALCFLQRKDVDTCQMVSKQWRNMVDDIAGALPRHYVHSVEWHAWDFKVCSLAFGHSAFCWSRRAGIFIYSFLLHL